MAVPVWSSGQVLTASDVNTWFVPISAIKTSTESVTSSVTLQNDDQLVVALAANSTYFVQMVIRYDGATAGDIQVQFTGPGGATIFGQWVGNPFSAAGLTDVRVVPLIAFSAAEAFGCLGAGTDTSLSFQGNVATGGSAGNLQLQWAQGTSNGTATRVFGQSFIAAWRIS